MYPDFFNARRQYGLTGVERITHAVRRVLLRRKTQEVDVRDVRAGDRYLFDFPGTGPYLSAPIKRDPQWIEQPLGSIIPTGWWISFDGGFAVSHELGTKVRVAR